MGAQWQCRGKGHINYPLPSGVRYVKPGTIVKEREWWKPAIGEAVVDTIMSRTGTHYIVVYIFSNSIEVGDKIATVHGLKFTLGEIVEDDDMPRILDRVTGKLFIPSVMLSTKNVGGDSEVR